MVTVLEFSVFSALVYYGETFFFVAFLTALFSLFVFSEGFKGFKEF